MWFLKQDILGITQFENEYTDYKMLGWVNLFQKFEIEKYAVVNSFYPKKMERHLKKKIGHTGMQICMDLRIK